MASELVWLLIRLCHAADPLDEHELISVLDARQPAVQIAEAELARADGARLGAAGGYDVKVKAKADTAVLGYYAWSAAEAGVEQQIPGWGLRLGAGYRQSSGELPVYYAERQTVEQGELFASLAVPVLRGGPTDELRAGIAVAEAGRDVAAARARLLQVELQREARAAYWGWVAAAAKLRIAEQQVTLADSRDSAIRSRVERGDLPPIAAVDNQRAVFERRAEVAAQQQKLQQTAAKLSLYWRDADGVPVVPAHDAAPLAPQPPSVEPGGVDLDAALVQIATARPELAELDAALRQIDAELKLARTERLPGLDLVGAAAQGIGGGYGAGAKPELIVGMRFDAAAQQRKARGKSEELVAKRAAIEHKRRLVLDKAQADLRSAAAAVQGTAAAWDLARQGAAAADALAEAERRRFVAGDTDLLTVYLREQAAGKAAGEVADALSAWHIALAELDAAQARAAAAPLSGR